LSSLVFGYGKRHTKKEEAKFFNNLQIQLCFKTNLKNTISSMNIRYSIKFLEWKKRLAIDKAFFKRLKNPWQSFSISLFFGRKYVKFLVE